MLDAKDYKPGDPIYSYVDNEGNNIHDFEALIADGWRVD